jgi:hypothetical protein
MSNSVNEFVAKAKVAGLNDQQIVDKLVAGGWSEADARVALVGDLQAPPPPHHGSHHSNPSVSAHPLGNQNNPITVVSKISTRDTEYSIMYVCLLILTLGVGGVLHQILFSVFDGSGSDWWSGGAFGVTMIIVSLPIFSYLFLRLKKAELKKPELLRSQTRHKGVKGMTLISFLALLIHAVIFVFMTIGTHGSFSKGLAHLAVTILVAGSVFVYFWRDEHRNYKEE